MLYRTKLQCRFIHWDDQTTEYVDKGFKTNLRSPTPEIIKSEKATNAYKLIFNHKFRIINPNKEIVLSCIFESNFLIEYEKNTTTIADLELIILDASYEFAGRFYKAKNDKIKDVVAIIPNEIQRHSLAELLHRKLYQEGLL